MKLKDNNNRSGQHHVNTVTINSPQGYIHDRKDSDTAFILVNGKLENIQSQRNRSLQKQIGEQMSHIQLKGENRLVSEFKQ